MRRFTDVRPRAGGHGGNDVGAPVGMFMDPDVDMPHPDRIASDPDMPGAPIIIFIAIPAHVFVSIPEAIVGNESHDGHLRRRWWPIVGTTGGQGQDGNAGNRDRQGNFARGFHNV